MATKTYIQVGGQSYDASQVATPANRDFRDAWQHDGSVITVNMPKARDIHRDKIRAARVAEFAKNDVAINDALLSGVQADKDAALARRDELRDATADPAIEAATTPEELAAVAPAGLTL